MKTFICYITALTPGGLREHQGLEFADNAQEAAEDTFRRYSWAEEVTVTPVDGSERAHHFSRGPDGPVEEDTTRRFN